MNRRAKQQPASSRALRASAEEAREDAPSDPERPGGKPSSRARANLVQTVSTELRQEIVGGGLGIGARLPSEAELTRRFGVSRTVVREAIAVLRADGLVEARQGAGVFVISTQDKRYTLLGPSDSARISTIIETLELRAAVEIEAAGLAAQRRSPAQAEAVIEAVEAIDALIETGGATSRADRAFHLTIADATNNPRFREFLELLGDHVIPRVALRGSGDDRAPTHYLRQIQAEHREIADAIAAGDPEAAREAMRVHLKGGQERYRAYMRKT